VVDRARGLTGSDALEAELSVRGLAAPLPRVPFFFV
jgi:hypothetical protein